MPVVIGAKPEGNFKNPIALLGDCHRRIERFLSVLIRVSELRNSPLNPQQAASLETALQYFRDAAPKHTADEEESLFPRLRSLDRTEVQAVLSRVESLERDHARAEGLHAEVERLGRLWLAEGSLSEVQSGRFSECVKELKELYKNHIDLEDLELFPVADKALSASDKDAIGREMASRRA